MDRVVIKKSALRALIREMLDNKLPIQSNPIAGKDKDLTHVEDDEELEPKRQEMPQE